MWNWLVAWVIGMMLGSLFLYSGLQKSLAPYEFAEAILAYRLLPPGLVGLVAAILPWLEILAGFFIILGYCLGTLKYLVGLLSRHLHPRQRLDQLLRRSGLAVLIILTALFMVTLTVTQIRGLKIDCGCGIFWHRQVGLAALLEDCLLFIAAAGLYRWEVKIEARMGQT